MSEYTLGRLYSEHIGKVSDKWSGYLRTYDRVLAIYQQRPIRLLEVGVQNGGSLEIWSKYFQNALKLVGCDVNPACRQLDFEDPRIVVVVGDANSHAIESEILREAPEFEVFIDDGSHRSSDIVKSFIRYFPHVSDSGIFIVEDLHCSYWQEYEGGLFNPFSAIAFFKRLADVINHEHWGIEKGCADILSSFCSKFDLQVREEVLQHIHSIEFTNSMCIVRKALPEHNQLQRRVIVGSVAVVQPVRVFAPPDQTGNEWTSRSLPPEEELFLRIKELAERDGVIAGLRQALAQYAGRIRDVERELATVYASRSDVERELATVYASRSWRMTRPLRMFMGILRRNANFLGRP
jgi:hypothetical protein